jgi:hypothetical protein
MPTQKEDSMEQVVRNMVERDRMVGRSRNTAGRRFAGMLAATIVVMALAAMPVVAQEQLPFSGTYRGTVAFTSPTSGAFQGSGTASYLGKSTIVGTVQAVGPASSCSDGFAAQHTVTLTAANGDQLSLVVTDDSCQVAPGMYEGTGTYEITGGTGRFAGATGSGTFDGRGDFNTGTFLQTFNGTISF